MHGQIYDTLIEGDMSLTLARVRNDDEITDLSPLQEYLVCHDLWQYFSEQLSNYKGYVCQWKIIDEQLHLVSFKSFSPRLNKTSQIFGDIPIDSFKDEREKNPDLMNAVKKVELVARKKIGLNHAKHKEVSRLIDEIYDLIIQVTPVAYNDEKDHYDFPVDTTRVFAEWFTGNIFAYHGVPEHDEDLNGWAYRFEAGVMIGKTPQHIKRYNEIELDLGDIPYDHANERQINP